MATTEELLQRREQLVQQLQGQSVDRKQFSAGTMNSERMRLSGTAQQKPEPDTGLPNLVGDGIKNKRQEANIIDAKTRLPNPGEQGFVGPVIPEGVTPEQPTFLERGKRLAASAFDAGDIPLSERLSRFGAGSAQTLVGGVGEALEPLVEIIEPPLTFAAETLDKASEPITRVLENALGEERTKDIQAKADKVLAQGEAAFENLNQEQKDMLRTSLELFSAFPIGRGVAAAEASAVKGAKNVIQTTKDLVNKATPIVDEKLRQFSEFAIDKSAKKLDEALGADTAKQLQKASEETFKSIKPRLTKKRDLKRVRSNMETANAEIIARGFKPTDLGSYQEAISQTKRSIWNELEDQLRRGGEQGLEVDLTSIASEIKEMAQSPALRRSNVTAATQLDNFADDLIRDGQRINVLEAEEIKQFLNAEVGGLFGEVNLSKPLKEAKKKVSGDIGRQLDEILSKGEKGQFADLKRKYGALRDIEEDVIKRKIVFDRQNPEGLISSVSKIQGLGNVLRGVAGGGFEQIARGFGELATGQIIKRSNDANNLIRKAFNRLEKVIPGNKTPSGPIRGSNIPELPERTATQPAAIPLPEAGRLEASEQALTGQFSQ